MDRILLELTHFQPSIGRVLSVGPDDCPLNMQTSKTESRAVNVALAHINAWSNHNYNEARRYLSDDVHVSVSTTQPLMPATDTIGINEYMDGLTKFGQIVVPGSAQIKSSSGDDQNALITVTVKVTMSPGGPLVPLVGARLYSIDDKGKIKAERVIFCVLSNN